MATDQDKVLEMIEEQKTMRDPFQKLAQRRATKAVEETLSEAQVMAGGQPQEGTVKRSELIREAPGSLRGMLDASDPMGREFSSEGLDKVFGKYGLEELAQGLALNEFGQLQLLLRLKDKFGENFFENAEARKVMDAFKLALKNNKDEARESFSKMLASGERTLSVLMGGE